MQPHPRTTRTISLIKIYSKGAFSLQTGHAWDPQELAECLGSGCSGSFLGQNCKTTLILKTVLDVSQTLKI